MKFSAIIDDFSQGEVSPLVLAKLSSSEVKNGLDLNINMVPDPHGPLVGRQGFKHIAPIPATDLNATLFDFEMYEGKTLTIVFYDNQVTIYNISAGVQTTTTLATPYTADTLHGAARDRHNLEGIKTPDGESIYFLHKSVTPWIMTIADNATVSDTELTVSFAAVTFTDIPSEWISDNFPTCMAFFQDRAWFSGCAKNPETFWGSKSSSGNYHIMTLGTVADDAVRFTLQKEGLIKWLSGHSTLLIGSDYGEFIASGSAVTIEPNDIQIEPQSAYGSKRITPEFIGDEVLYVSSDGRKLRSMWWRWVESGWKSIDLTFTGEHLTSGGIKDISYSRDPASIIFMLTATNDLIGCSFRRKNDNDPIVGWYRIQTGDEISAITGMCTVQDSGISSAVIAARVTVDGVEALHLMQQDAKDIYGDDLVMLDNYCEKTPVIEVKNYLDFEVIDEWDLHWALLEWSSADLTLPGTMVIINAGEGNYIEQTITVESVVVHNLVWTYDTNLQSCEVEIFDGTTDILITTSGSFTNDAWETQTLIFTPTSNSIKIRYTVLGITSGSVLFKNMFLDSVEGGNVIRAIEYLEGQEVSVIGDGAVLPVKTVTDGIVTLDYNYDKVYIGHKYSQKVVTLPYFIYEKQLAYNQKLWSEIYCFIYNSFPPLINDKRNGTRHPVTIMGEGEASTTGMVQVYNKGWDRLAKITIEQDVPKPLIILGIYGDINFE